MEGWKGGKGVRRNHQNLPACTPHTPPCSEGWGGAWEPATNRGMQQRQSTTVLPLRTSPLPTHPPKPMMTMTMSTIMMSAKMAASTRGAGTWDSTTHTHINQRGSRTCHINIRDMQHHLSDNNTWQRSPASTHLQPMRVCILPPLASMYAAMGLSRRSSGEPLSIRRTDASVLVAKNWKMVSMQRAEMLSQSRKPRA